MNDDAIDLSMTQTGLGDVAYICDLRKSPGLAPGGLFRGPQLRLVGNPLGLVAIVFVARRAFQGVLGRIHDQPPLVVLLLALDRTERYSNVFFSSTEKTANTDDEGVDAAFLIYKHVDDLAESKLSAQSSVECGPISRRLTRKLFCSEDALRQVPNCGRQGKTKLDC